MRLVRRINPVYALAIFLALATIAYAILTTQPNYGARTGSVFDNGPGGAGALRRAIERVGGMTTVLQGDVFAIDASRVGVVFLLEARELLTPSDVAAIRTFIRSGGTVVVASDVGLLERPLTDAFGVRFATPAAPGAYELRGPFTNPPTRLVSFDRGASLELGEHAWPVASDGRLPTIAMALEGRGALIVVGSLWPFIAEGLAYHDNGRFALTLATQALGTGRAVAFDEYHHGSHPSADLFVLIERTWPGRALLFAAAGVFVYLLMSGRRFGSPVPLDPRPPRSSLDYVRGFAGLVRRSGRGEIARRRLRRDLHTELARAQGLDPATPFERTLTAVAASDPARAARARAADTALGKRLRDDALLRTVRDIEALIGTTNARA
jgi:hypothetical protein